jgi:hypothetical protein
MTENSNVKVSPQETKRSANWFSTLRPVLKFSLIELAVYLVIGAIGLIKFAVNS